MIFYYVPNPASYGYHDVQPFLLYDTVRNQYCIYDSDGSQQALHRLKQRFDL